MSFDPAEAATERLAALQLSPDKAADSGRAVQSLDSVREAEPQATERSAGRISSGPAVGGLGQAKEALRRLIVWPILFREEAKRLGLRWPTGLLLHGPPGCGKTVLVHSVAAECQSLVQEVLASSIFGAYLGESEQRLRAAFKSASDAAASGQNVVLLLDEADTLCPVRHPSRPHEARIVGQILTLLDSLSPESDAEGRVCVVAATNRPNAIDPALRRPHRLDAEVAITLPSLQDRAAILALHTAGMPLAGDCDLAWVAAKTHGFSGADLAALCREAGTRALMAAERGSSCSSADDCRQQVLAEDFAACLGRMGPSLTRGIDMELSPVPWSDIGGLHDVKRRLQQAVEWPLQHPQAFQRLAVSPLHGVLLHGPPGCCKTRLARAAATASGARLHALSGAQVYSSYVGEGEARLRAAFHRARSVAPAILFLDELDALVGRRDDSPGAGGGGAAEASQRLLSVLLTEMDGLEHCTGVLVMAATNRPAAIDAALLRPGRFDALLYVPPPDAAGRLETLEVHTRSTPLGRDVDLQAIAAATELFTGAELEGLCAEAALTALREDITGAQFVSHRHFEAALAAIPCTLTAETVQQFASWNPRQPLSVG